VRAGGSAGVEPDLDRPERRRVGRQLREGLGPERLGEPPGEVLHGVEVLQRRPGDGRQERLGLLRPLAELPGDAFPLKFREQVAPAHELVQRVRHLQQVVVVLHRVTDTPVHVF